MRQPVLIVGMGKSGKAAQRLLRLLKYPENEIKTFDNKSGVADFSNPEDLFDLNPRLLVVSPGVDLKSSWIQKLIKNGTDLTSELNLAAEKLTTERVVGITGSMGKSTTTSLLEAGALAFSPTSFAGGNLGIPLADYISDVLENKRPRAEWILLELSSYQLENCDSLKTEASILTALSPNHLERYASLEDYYSSKWALKEKTKGPFFLNYDNLELVRWCDSKVDSQCVRVRAHDLQKYDIKSAKLVGSHNQQNLALSIQVALYLKWPQHAIEAMKNYPGLSHRLEYVGEYQGIKFINDSKATTIESVLAAVDSSADLVSSRGKLHILVGGKDKNLPWEDLSVLSPRPNLKFYFFGEYAKSAQAKSKLTGSSFAKLKEAFDSSVQHARKGDVILLSPGGSSLDEFKNFEERGQFFKDCASTWGLR